MSSLTASDVFNCKARSEEYGRIIIRLAECEAKSRKGFHSEDDRRKMEGEIDSLHSRKNEIDIEMIALAEKMDEAEKPESTRKTENLLQALTCISMVEYGYDPTSGKSNAPTDIAKALSERGLTFDQKTIRNWLKEGANLLPKK